MNNRNYNIYFHTHTISGIIISAILFVIFFAGSFAFFKSEISNWQKNVSNPTASRYELDFNTITDSLNKEYGLYGRNVSFYVYPHTPRLGVSVSESKDTTNKAKGGFFYYDIQKHTRSDYKQSYDLGEFLYRLHFLAQVNSIANVGFPLGYYIAGLVAFLFLFALITGLLLHWNKIVANFYVFRPWEKLKTVWTDLHTALGVISFPFLLIFAVTGSFFLISYPLFTQPTAKIQFGGNEDSLNAVLGYNQRKTEFANIPLKNKADVNYFLEQAAAKWDHTRLSSLQLVNYGDASMEVIVKNVLPTQQKFVSSGEVIYEVASRQALEAKDPNRPSGYADVVQNLIYNLHFGNYGGYAVKILYFLLGICGCVVIISGVLIWLTARNKKSIPEKKKRFNEWLTHIYLSISLGMFPVTAAAFIAVKIQPNGGTAFIYPFYFWSWLAVAFLLSIRKNNYKTNRDCMLSGAIIGLAIPIVNGIVTGNWIWVTYNKGYSDILLIDLFWVIVSAAAFTCWWLIVKKQRAAQAKKPVVIEENNN